MITMPNCTRYVFLLLLAVLIAGCPQQTAPPAAPAATTPAPAPAAPPAALPSVVNAITGNPIPTSGASPCGIAGVSETISDVSFTSVKGELLTLSMLKDLKKVILVDFWGLACSACVEGLDAYQKDTDFVGNPQLEIIAVSRDTNKTAVKQFAQEHGWKFPVVMITPEIQKALLSSGADDLPQVRIIDQQGKLRYKLGSTDATHEKIKCAVDALIGK
jgi:peroxiredoxin